MDTLVSEQASNDGDVQTDISGQTTVGVLPAGDSGTAKQPTNQDAKKQRISDKEWQEMAEKVKQGEQAVLQVANIAKAFGIKPEKNAESVDVVAALTQKVESLEMQANRAKWEKDNPAVDSAEYREEWEKILKDKGHLVKSGDLTYDDLFTMIRKPSKSTSHRDFKDQELNIGSVPVASKSVTVGSEIDPDIYIAMKKAGYTDEQIKASA